VVESEITWLNRRIDGRFRNMVETGALDECRRFLAAGVDPTLPAARVLGAEPLSAHLRGDLSLDAAITTSVTATRRFAKRQRTWMRNRMVDWSRVAPGPDAAAAVPEA
jgi:tRNA dimethylallyltransferase